ncbi:MULTISPECIES: DUF6434 domain-containing protein [unclassified Pedobacter]|uniref:DUF6434 domain-containing protein n=1 Tax=Pedobacter TaxID=84567 RepID=UPI000B4AAC1E|nr:MULTISPECIES: DUF6434 domain-containing protein [unclassified Pedobacter]MCX2431141.1 DUF6434 domain-containing protein [Pedobacter sp. GR22-10]MCX2584565.1 DUF6434 domain-containing protein [Pedobacter sp. MR22-3]OWK69090.1 hypothetical protein CBW18_18635 [Pedobacter sp. AJM]
MSKFNWHSETLTDQTIITKDFKNTQNVRRYFQSHFGENWKNNRIFMNWFKENEGKTLKEAVDEFRKRNN